MSFPISCIPVVGGLQQDGGLTLRVQGDPPDGEFRAKALQSGVQWQFGISFDPVPQTPPTLQPTIPELILPSGGQPYFLIHLRTATTTDPNNGGTIGGGGVQLRTLNQGLTSITVTVVFNPPDGDPGTGTKTFPIVVRTP